MPNSTAQHSTAQHSTAQHSTAQHSTAQHSTAQHSTAQHSTAQHSTAQRDLNADTSQAFLNELDQTLWTAADKLRKNLDAANYKHIVLGFIFLKYISDSFTDFQAKLKTQLTTPESELYLDPALFDEQEFSQILAEELEQRDYYAAENIFWVPEQARWDNIKSLSKLNLGDELPWGDKFKGVSRLIDDAFEAIERENPKLKGVLQRIAGFGVPDEMLTGLIDLFSRTNFTQPMHNGEPVHLQAKDILGHVYEYFLGQFALAEGKKGGQYFTPKSIVTLIVEMLEPYSGRIYDPAMGSGGFFVQADRFIQAHAGNRNAISVYGQESNSTTRKLAVMNMAIRGIPFDFGDKPEDTLLNPLHIDKKMDVVMANPPFNQKEWWNESLANDPRWAYGTPPQGNANFAWLQHMIYHLSPKGKMALLLANGSMSSQTSGEGDIRKNIVQADLVEAMIALPNQLFTNTQIPACIWIINKAKARKGEVLFINATQIGYLKDRVLRDFTADDIAKISDTYHNWQKQNGYENIPAFCYCATLDEIAKNDFVLTAGRYVGAVQEENDGVPFAEKMQELTALLNEQFKQGRELEQQIAENLKGLGYGI
ncbi:class I SAM-dependent DNA methyltransferase [Mannheimia haemolytica]|uniref:class I SAM-dependent DNA methyltransferase n=1 Tax=Mannheimia haemolytica TaxID=75985 RepID=UPI0009BA07B1|nr:class I SAM-dependent DNA methyltransferase [Mannheimia haemolytica]AGI35601.2 restriction endonuclease subunit M [Mannheimia haemolytica USDA-ARS-USMARC-185]MDW0363591.1 class I SAM-dependent DNA methyltransferase [Mannheimia haemolytica]MDW0397569.1 class I SAM-dependent DNA methyltransferase [Mannheimia haemolytica]MDW0527510.1 class I SAM-dependent DNA methyltransferase [Mannheimia haemolytica]MDW0693966.1 class I SAM-dependent DNA methyltransferase [Mannheimia haemolytica]